MKSTQAMRNRIRELTDTVRDDYDRAVLCVVDDLEAMLGTLSRVGLPCGECHLRPGELCDVCGRLAPGAP